MKTAVACQRAGIEHILGLRVRVVPERGYRTWGERVGELILFAMDESGWLSLVGLTSRGFLGGADRCKPRVDWRDLESYSEGVIAFTGMPGSGGILSAAIEHSSNPAEPIEAYGLTRRLIEQRSAISTVACKAAGIFPNARHICFGVFRYSFALLCAVWARRPLSS